MMLWGNVCVLLEHVSQQQWFSGPQLMHSRYRGAGGSSFSVCASVPLEYFCPIFMKLISHTAPTFPHCFASVISNEFFIYAANRCSHVRKTRPGNGWASCSGGGERLWLYKSTTVSVMMFDNYLVLQRNIWVLPLLSNWLSIQLMWQNSLPCLLLQKTYLPLLFIPISGVILSKTVMQTKNMYSLFLCHVTHISNVFKAS